MSPQELLLLKKENIEFYICELKIIKKHGRRRQAVRQRIVIPPFRGFESPRLPQSNFLFRAQKIKDLFNKFQVFHFFASDGIIGASPI